MESAGSKWIGSEQVSEQEHRSMIDRFLKDIPHDRLGLDDVESPDEAANSHVPDHSIRGIVRECDSTVETLRWIEYDLVTIIDRVRDESFRDDLKEIEFWRTASDEEVAFARKRVKGDRTAGGAISPPRAKRSPQPKLAKNVEGGVEKEGDQDPKAHEEDKELCQMMRYGGASRIELQVQVAALKRQLHDESKARDEAERNAKRFKDELDRLTYAALNVEIPESIAKFDDGTMEKAALLKELAIARQLFKDAEVQHLDAAACADHEEASTSKEKPRSRKRWKDDLSLTGRGHFSDTTLILSPRRRLLGCSRLSGSQPPFNLDFRSCHHGNKGKECSGGRSR
eukprot:763396-Hanusia_phi.AAC.2